MTDNLALWEKLGKTDPAHTKSFSRSGGFKGTAIKPMWSYKRMTEEFGPVGQGWGVYRPEFQVVPASEGEVLVFCTVSIWYQKPDQIAFGVGGDKAVGKNKYGLSADDEAFKKAYTDAVTNALKMIGVGADVHMGMFDDNKYVNAMKEEFGEEPKTSEPKRSAPKNDDARNLYSTLQSAMRLATTKAELRAWWQISANVEARNRLSSDWQSNLREEFIELGKSLPEGHPEKEAA
ncbi:hypothetical protein ACTJJ7_20175 [Phyllobacterium sp. 22229]|uniref:hypothetical protein n=1 Tax=Phyllobacterium sp. 22229 TaxID=3453895 RepID=UPI003F874442